MLRGDHLFNNWWLVHQQHCSWRLRSPMPIFSFLICGLVFANCYMSLRKHAHAPCLICMRFIVGWLSQMVLRRDYNGFQVAVGRMWTICYNPQCLPQSNRLNEIAAWSVLPSVRCWCLISRSTRVAQHGSWFGLSSNTCSTLALFNKSECKAHTACHVLGAPYGWQYVLRESGETRLI